MGRPSLRLVCGVIAAATFAAPAPAAAQGQQQAAIGIATGVVATGIGRGAYTLGGGGSWGATIGGWFPLVLRGSVQATGFAGGEPGLFLRGEAGAGGRVSESVWLDLVAGAAVSSWRTCGAANCGRINGIVPQASARLVIFGPYFDRSVGLAIDVGGFWVVRSIVHEGLTFTASAGPVWAFSGR